MRLPDFLVIGGQKTGTKWLWHNLNHHPRIHIPPGGGMEVHYFDDDDHVGDVDWYSRHFHPSKGEDIIGDITPDYAILKWDRIQHAKEIIPDAKIIYTLRNPKERAISHLRMIFKKSKLGYPKEKKGLELHPHDHPEEMVKFCREGESRYHGSYPTNIRRWREAYSNTMIVLPYELLCSDPTSYLNRILEHLGVEGKADEGYPLYDRHHVSVQYPIDWRVLQALDDIYNEEIEALSPLVDFDVTRWLQPLKPS